MFGGFDLSSIVEAGNKLKEGVGNNIVSWDHDADDEIPTEDGLEQSAAGSSEPQAESSAWDSLGLGNALQKVHDTNSSLEHLWGNRLSQLPDFSAYLAGASEQEAPIEGTAAGKEYQSSPAVATNDAADLQYPATQPTTGRLQNGVDIDALCAGQYVRRPPHYVKQLREDTSESGAEADVQAADRQVAHSTSWNARKDSREPDMEYASPAVDCMQSNGADERWHQQEFASLNEETSCRLLGADQHAHASSGTPQQQSQTSVQSNLSLPRVNSKLGSESDCQPASPGEVQGLDTQQSTIAAASSSLATGRISAEAESSPVAILASEESHVVESEPANLLETAPDLGQLVQDPCSPAEETCAAVTNAATSAPDVAALASLPTTIEEANAALKQVQEALAVRELQLERKSREAFDTEARCQQLQEQLMLQTAADSQPSLDSVRAEAAQRVAAAERKVFALTKERDALKRQSGKLNSASELLKEKDDIIRQVMEEGEALSKKQLVQENTIKKLRATNKEAAEKFSALQAAFASEQARLRSAMQTSSALELAKQELEERRTSELQQEREHYQGLLAKARAAQEKAEQSAAAGEHDASVRMLKDAEARCEAAEEATAELRATLEQQQATFAYREDRSAREVAELQRRVTEADARHEELAARLPEATQPLVRQLESMRAAADAQAASWAAAEFSLSRRRADAEARATAATEASRAAIERLQATQGRIAVLAGALEAAKAEAADCQAAADAQRQTAAEAESRAARLQDRLQTATDAAAADRAEIAELQQRLRDVSAARDELTADVARLTDDLAAADVTAQHCRQQLQDQQQHARSHAGGTGPPPALPGPGYKWVLVREGNEGSNIRQSLVQQQQASQTEQWHSTAADQASSHGASDVAKVSALRESLRHRDDQLAALLSEIGRLEATRDSLSEDLVAAAQAQAAAAEAQEDAAAAHDQAQLMAVRLAAAEELLGEREESLAELRADLADVKQVYREQIEFCVAALAAAQQHSEMVTSPTAKMQAVYGNLAQAQSQAQELRVRPGSS